MENIPSLAAQPDLFIQWQLVFFRAGTRKNEQMQPIVEQLNNEDIRNLGAYYASLTPPKASKPDDNPDLSTKGAQAAAGRRCASCHTDTYAGTKAVARVAGQREEYLVKALRDYKSGVRSGGAHGGDGGCRLSPQRRGDRGARALSRAFVDAQSSLRKRRDPYSAAFIGGTVCFSSARHLLGGMGPCIRRRDSPNCYPRCFSYALRWV